MKSEMGDFEKEDWSTSALLTNNQNQSVPIDARGH
jgi:hypothetical protein